MTMTFFVIFIYLVIPLFFFSDRFARLIEGLKLSSFLGQIFFITAYILPALFHLYFNNSYDESITSKHFVFIYLVVLAFLPTSFHFFAGNKRKYMVSQGKRERPAGPKGKGKVTNECFD